MSTTVYKCPSCDAPLTYSAKTGKFVCDYCVSSFTEQEVQELWEKKEQKQPRAQESKASDSGEDGEARVFVCSQCGAEVVTDENTAATHCSFCHNPAIISERLSGEFKPSRVIPFAIDKKAAEGMFLTYLKGRPFLPKSFKYTAKKDKLTGLYAPFWLFGTNAEAKLIANAENVRVHRVGNKEITERDHYAVERAANMSFDNLPVDASERLDDRLMELIEPYEYSGVKDFSMSYLSGFFAEKYDETAQEVAPRAQKRFEDYAQKETLKTITGYSSVSVQNADVVLSDVATDYLLLPVWMMNYKYKEKTYTFAINGQTGRMVGKLPVSALRIFAWGAAIFAAVFLAAFLGGMLL